MMRRARGFTLIELLVAIAAMALLAMMSWRGLDGMVRAEAVNRERGDALLTLQAGLAQWNADLDAVVQLGQTTPIDWDGRVLRITRRSNQPAPGNAPDAPPQPMVQVVAWTLRADADGARWRRWQSPPLDTRPGWQQAWNLATTWAQDSGSELRRAETAVLPLDGWQLYYFRNDGWSAAVGASTLGGLTPIPDGVRLMLSLPAGPGLAGLITRDWVRPTLGGTKT